MYFIAVLLLEGSLNLISLLRTNKQGNPKGQLGLSDPRLPKLIAPSKELGSKGGEVPTETSQVKSVGVYITQNPTNICLSTFLNPTGDVKIVK